MKKNIITVSRQFGSGGRTIGRTVAQRLGIPCYDKELVDKVALESGERPPRARAAFPSPSWATACPASWEACRPTISSGPSSIT